MARARTGSGIGLALLAITGCALDRTALGGGDTGARQDRDSGRDSRDGGRDSRDGGTLCTEGGCDDGSPCTRDRCVPAIGCTHEPIDGVLCDDGVLCNGADRCGDGSCSVHDGIDPCPGSSRCETESDRCVGCADDLDCPPRMVGGFGACEPASDDPCASAGTRSRTITTYACVEGTCEPTTSSESEACVRETDGLACGAPSIGSWGECTYDDPCATAGLRTRSLTSYVCRDGACESVVGTETDPSGCVRDTNGAECGPIERNGGDCAYSSPCAETGSRPVTTIRPLCSAGRCEPVASSDSEPCSRSTEGALCGSEVCEDWSPCTSAAECATTGTQSRTCRAEACSSGTCGAVGSRTETASCTIDSSGMDCSIRRTCRPCRARGGACPPGMMGTRICIGPDGNCTDGRCMGEPMRVSCTC